MKTNIQLFVEKLKAVIDVEKELMFAAVENQAEKSFENLTKERSKTADDIKAMESSLQKTDELLNRGLTNAEII